MSTLMMGLIVTGYSSALAFVWKKRIEEQLPIVITGLILILYAFGIAFLTSFLINLCGSPTFFISSNL